ncbi:MAG TPA: hypothetical protein VGW33_11585 [Terriglobia bacterium]|nr:hypothetical protein [Terriglobia bacterium]
MNLSNCRLRFLRVVCAFVVVAGFAAVRPAQAQQLDPNLYAAMRWRLIGPFRAGRVTAVAGVPGDPAVYYMGTPGGGVWKTTDGGRVWKPIFDQERVASIGAVAVAPSNPNILYVGTGEQTPGNGVYKSTDGGDTWTNVGLRGTHFIQAIIIDPRNPNIVIVGATGDFTASTERGVFKSTDGGQTWNKVLYRDDTTAVVDLCSDPGNRKVLYASLWRRAFRFGPPQPGEKRPAPYSGIYKSTDEGSHWKPLSGKGLPAGDLGRIGIAVAPGNRGRRLYAIIAQGFYRSDDAGATWARSTTDPRILGNGYFSRVFVDPRNPDVLYVAQTSLYRSTDGGHTFESYTGAPSGDDFHVLWIDPQDPRRMILGVDQGATISVDGGQTWSSWYNQPTGQFYHVSTDNAFPYHVYAAQQDSGTAAVASRSDYGEISDRDVYSIGGFEYCYIEADPTNPNIVYSGGWYGSALRFDRTTGQFATVFIPGKKYHTAAAPALAFSPQDPHKLYLGAQYLLESTDQGMTWREISPDLTAKPPAQKEGPPPPPAFGAAFSGISALSPSPVKANEIWAGTSNGQVELTRDGKTWRNVSPPDLPPSAGISAIDASHHDAATAFAVAGSFRTPQKPELYAYRTHDYGKTWQKITAGLPPSDPIRVVREDPVRRGLLYAGTATGVYLSFDDGDHWQSLQLNLPTATVTDLDVHGDDLVASTYGRALWILDDVTPLRQASAQVASSDVRLFRPETALRVRWDNNQDTPLPPEVPAGQNPPDGAIVDYYLKSAPAGEITLSIRDEKGNLVRRFSSAPPIRALPLPNVPSYWIAPPAALTKAAGMNRFVWDLRYPSPQALPFSYYGALLNYTEFTLADHAIPGATPRRQPQGPFVVPGTYTAELSVEGHTYRQPLTVKLDPRVRASQQDCEAQLDLERKMANGLKASYEAYHQVETLRSAFSDRQKALAANAKPPDTKAPDAKETDAKDAAEALENLKKKANAVADGTPTAPGLGSVNRDLARLTTAIESADARPSATARAAAEESCQALDKALEAWHKLNTQDVAEFNSTLAQHKLAALPVAAPPAGVAGDPGCGR